MKVLVTGANGFVGNALCCYLARNGFQVVPVVRRFCSRMPNALVLAAEDDIAWLMALHGCDVVVHLGGKAQSDIKTQDPLLALREANVNPTVALYKRATQAGVQRFIFLSSAKVNGDRTAAGQFFNPEDIPAPGDAYAVSKWEAEQQLWTLAQQSGPEIVVIRPPVVYGPEVKGNFAMLVRWVQKGIALPLACVKNKRSMIAVENLLSFIALCADRDLSPKAAMQTFLVSDGPPVSTTEVLRQIATAYQSKARLFCLPAWFIQVCFRVLGKSAQAERLLGSLVVNDEKPRDLLGWIPPITMAEQLQRMRSAAVS
jgi:nucleoside-diphosphate-sugar epimerase